MAGEEELGASIPTVFQRNISWVVLNVVRMLRDYNCSVLHRIEELKQLFTSMYQYVPVCTNVNEVCTSMYLILNEYIPVD